MNTMETVEIDPMGRILQVEDPLELFLMLESFQKSLNQAEKDCLEMWGRFDHSSTKHDLKALNDRYLDTEVYNGLILTAKNWLLIMISKPLH